MRELLALGFLAALVGFGGCSSKVAPSCSKQPELGVLDSAERLALADALSRYGSRCKRQDFQCDVSLIRNNGGEILVTVASVYPDTESGHCLQAPGDQDLVTYRPDGTFMRRVMSL
jgi:hypothetical protein